MMNHSILIGRLTRDPELRYTASGIAVAQFTLAVDRYSKDKTQKEADFIPIVVWQKQAENCVKYTKKGSLVAVEGRIQTRNYENNEGKRVYVTEVIANSVKFLDGFGGKETGKEKPSTPKEDNSLGIADEDLPF